MNSYELVGQILFVYDKTGIHEFCKIHRVEPEKFNMQVVINDKLKDCSEMFKGLSSFNKFVIIPHDAENCISMFEGCLKFNQPVAIPLNVKYTSNMFRGCISLNKVVTLPPIMKEYDYMFESCTNLKAPIKVPYGVDGINMFFDCPGEYDSYVCEYKYSEDGKRITVEDLEQNAGMLMKVMEQCMDYKTWFAYKFPFGARSYVEIEKATRVPVTI